MAMNDSEAAAVRANLFRVVHPLIDERPDFPWHRDEREMVTATLEESSQALALDLFGTVQRLPSRDLIVGRWVEALGLNVEGPWELVAEFLIPRELLGERKSTQLDVLAKGQRGIIVFECKFTEADGGSCSQPHPLGKGANQGKKQCNGNYELQTNPIDGRQSKCALAPKGVKYWDFVPEVMNVDPARNYAPCPFAGGWYQWMRNLVATLSLSRSQGVPGAFVVAYADGPFPMATKIHGPAWGALQDAVAGCEVPLHVASYQQLLGWAREAASPSDGSVVEELESWMVGKMTEVGMRSTLAAMR